MMKELCLELHDRVLESVRGVLDGHCAEIGRLVRTRFEDPQPPARSVRGSPFSVFRELQKKLEAAKVKF